MTDQVKELWAWIADGEDSFFALSVGRDHFPCVCAKKSTAEMLAPQVLEAARQVGVKVRLVHFIRDDRPLD